MDEFKFTKGIWAIDPIKTGIVRAGAYMRIEQTIEAENYTNIFNEDMMTEEGDANAKLIAAAPDLLDACMGVLKCLENANHRAYERDLLRKAISKATERIQD